MSLLTREGVQSRRLVVYVDSREVLGAVSEKTIELTKDQLHVSEFGFLVSRL